MAVVYQTPEGSALSFKIESTKPIDRFAFKAGAWNSVMRAGLQAACDFWIDNYLPLRFQAYARATGLYSGHKSKGLPLVKTGDLRAYVLQTTLATAKATAKSAAGVIHIPMPNVQNATPTKGHQYFNYASNPVVVSTLSSITARELTHMSEVCSRVMSEMIERATVTTTRKGRQVATLAPETQMTPSQLKQRAMAGQQRPRMTLRDFRHPASRSD